MNVSRFLLKSIFIWFCFLFLILTGMIRISAKDVDKRVVIKNDGWEIVGDLMIPEAEEKVPVVILLHKANGDRKVYRKMAGFLADHKIASLRMDLRGHGESINKGKFGPPFGQDEKMRAIIADSGDDVIAAFNYLAKLKSVDANRIGVVGASYSGEKMMEAARKDRYAKAYVALSPGSFSEESLKNIDSSQASYLFITSAEERYLQGFLADVRKNSKTAQTIEVSGQKHATDLLDSDPELSEMIAVWFKYSLGNRQ
jgi:dienelactone hydrolase